MTQLPTDPRELRAHLLEQFDADGREVMVLNPRQCAIRSKSHPDQWHVCTIDDESGLAVHCSGVKSEIDCRGWGIRHGVCSHSAATERALAEFAEESAARASVDLFERLELSYELAKRKLLPSQAVASERKPVPTVAPAPPVTPSPAEGSSSHPEPSALTPPPVTPSGAEDSQPVLTHSGMAFSAPTFRDRTFDPTDYVDAKQAARLRLEYDQFCERMDAVEVEHDRIGRNNRIGTEVHKGQSRPAYSPEDRKRMSALAEDWNAFKALRDARYALLKTLEMTPQGRAKAQAENDRQMDRLFKTDRSAA